MNPTNGGQDSFGSHPGQTAPNQPSYQPSRQSGLTAGSSQPSSADRQRQTASEIARKKVQAAYSATDWQKYHTAWQNYYQKYYSQYYAKAATEYIKQHQTQPPVNPVNPPTPEQSQAEDAAYLKNIVQKTSQTNQKSWHKLNKFPHLKPLIAGIAVTLFILFLQYNRVIFAPIMAYIAPGNETDTGITAIDPTITEAPSQDPRLIIPKLNVNVPVHFGISNDEATINAAMNNGVAQFAIPGADALPGQVGNLAISGHSAGDIYSNNQYKFIFSGLERLVAGDLIYINYEGVRYTYSVVGQETVEPTDVAALVYPTTKPMLTLITCTPLGTSRYRLLVTAEQINPNPDTATPSESENNSSSTSTETTMPANEKSFFEKITDWLFGRG